MAKLSSEHKRYIVQRLACYASPSEVRAELKELYSLDASLPQILYYDPSSAAGAADLKDEWKELFQSTREDYKVRTTDEAIAHQRHRIAIAGKRIAALMSRPAVNDDKVLKYLEFVERALGGAFTNRRELTGKDGGPIETRGGEMDDLSNADLAALAAKLAEECSSESP